MGNFEMDDECIGTEDCCCEKCIEERRGMEDEEYSNC